MEKKDRKPVIFFVVIVTMIILIILIENRDTLFKRPLTERQIAEEIEESNIKTVKAYEASRENLTIEQQLELGLIYQKDDEFDKAEQVYKSIINKVPNESTAIHRLGNLYIEKKDFGEALKYREKFTTLNKEDSAGYYYLSSLLLLSDTQKAYEISTKALKYANEEEKSTLEKYNSYLKEITEGDVQIYVELLTDPNIFLPNELKVAIINKVSTDVKELPAELVKLKGMLIENK